MHAYNVNTADEDESAAVVHAVQEATAFHTLVAVLGSKTGKLHAMLLCMAYQHALL